MKQAWWAINHTSVRLEWSPAGYLSRGGRPGPAAWRSGHDAPFAAGCVRVDTPEVAVRRVGSSPGGSQVTLGHR